MAKSKSDTIVVILIMSAICGLLFLLQVIGQGCEKAKYKIASGFEERRLEREAKLPAEERERLRAERKRKYREKYPPKTAEDIRMEKEHDEYLRLKLIYGDD